MIMKPKPLTGLIDVLGKVASGLKATVDLPEAERETMRQKLDETGRLVDTTLEMVIILDPIGVSWATIGADHDARNALMQKDAGILQTVTPAEIPAKFANLRLCVDHGHSRCVRRARPARGQEHRARE
jgi:hypothetical protein